MEEPGAANIEWRNGQPHSVTYDDIYNPIEDGIACAKHTFIEQSDLPARWRSVRQYTVAELGFGMAVNFLLTAGLWHETAPRSAVLRYVAFEKHPLSRGQLERALHAWPLGGIRQELTCRYPDSPVGSIRITFSQLRVILTIHIGDALEVIRGCRFAADTWFLDGFSPSRNPQMWSVELMKEVASHSRNGATVATYTSAGFVRRNLEACGFVVSKSSGFGKKSDMLRGVLADGRESSDGNLSMAPCRVAVVGAGIAGTSVARALALRGIEVDLIERAGQIATGASGVHAALIHAHPDMQGSTRSRLLQSGLDFTFQQRVDLDSLGRSEVPGFWNATGVVQFPVNKRIRKIMDFVATPHHRSDMPVLLDADGVSDCCGLPCGSSALFYQRAAFVNPSAYCHAQIRDVPPRGAGALQLSTCRDVIRLVKTHGGWRVECNDGRTITEADVVVLANAGDAANLVHSYSLPTVNATGYTAFVDSGSVDYRLSCAVYFGAYIGPTGRCDQWAAGGGTRFQGANDDPGAQPFLDQFATIRDWFPGLSIEALRMHDIRRGERATTPDALPLVGAIDSSAESSRIDHGSLFVSAGHGSLGMLTAPISGEIIASSILGEPLPVSGEIIHSLRPDRFA